MENKQVQPNLVQLVWEGLYAEGWKKVHEVSRI
jgi:hypothetical protein